MSPPVEKKHPGPTFSLSKTAAVMLAVAILALAGIWLTTGRQRAAGTGDLHREVRLLMDTGVEIVFPGDSPAEARQISGQVFDEMERLENRFSRDQAGSEILALNRGAGKGPVGVSPETIDLLEQAIYFADLSQGAFDPSIAPLLELWGFSDGNYRVPPESEIEALLPLIDYTQVKTDRSRQEISLLREGVCLDLGAIAKGYIVDRGLDRLRREGIGEGFIDAGGDIGIVGPKPDGQPWRIGIRHPREKEKILAVIPLTSGAVATSGDYERMFEEGGQRYHHILDPHTGYPANRLLSATVVASTATEADALSTALFVLGPEEGLKLIESLAGVEAILITPGLEIIVSSGLQGKVELAGS